MSTLSASLNEENEILEKQNLIKTQIIDKNYDKNLFFNFCLTSKPQNGDNLGNWSMQELQEVIDQFISEQSEIQQVALDKEQKIKDRRRDEFLKKNNFRIIRIESRRSVPTWEQIQSEIDYLMEDKTRMFTHICIDEINDNN